MHLVLHVGEKHWRMQWFNMSQSIDRYQHILKVLDISMLKFQLFVDSNMYYIKETRV